MRLVWIFYSGGSFHEHNTGFYYRRRRLNAMVVFPRMVTLLGRLVTPLVSLPFILIDKYDCLNR